MAPAPSRRRVLELAGTALAAGLAGCSQAGGSAASPTVTPAPVPTDVPTPAPTPTPNRPTPTPEDVGFDVTVLSGFTEASPARIEIAFWNAGEVRLTSLDGPTYLLPFVDDDHRALDAGGEPGLTLVPDDSGLDVAAEGPTSDGSGLTGTPSAPCWTATVEWPENLGTSGLTLQAASLAPDERRDHRYDLYFVDECRPGRFRFESRFILAAGDPPQEAGLRRAVLGFDAEVTEEMDVGVTVLEPVVERAAFQKRTSG